MRFMHNKTFRLSFNGSGFAQEKGGALPPYSPILTG